MASGLAKDDWEVVVTNIIHILKPGGAIQWTEADFLHSAYLRGGLDSIPRTIEYVGQRFHAGIAHRLQYGFSTLPMILRQKGLCDTFQDVVASDRVSETREALTRASYNGIFGWAHKMLIENAASPWPLQETTELREKVEEEIKGGCYCRFEIYVTIGFV